MDIVNQMFGDIDFSTYDCREAHFTALDYDGGIITGACNHVLCRDTVIIMQCAKCGARWCRTHAERIAENALQRIAKAKESQRAWASVIAMNEATRAQ